MNYTEHVDKLIDIVRNIKPNYPTVVTGGNGLGKSFIRKCVSQGISKQLNKKVIAADISMERRTGSHPELGGMGAFLRDMDSNPTSYETFNFLNALIVQKNRYLVIDEPEIGMSKESQLTVAHILNNNINRIIEESYGLMIITHSELIVQNINFPFEFINLDGFLTVDEWVNRDIIPTDVEVLRKNSIAISKEIQKRLSSK